MLVAFLSVAVMVVGGLITYGVIKNAKIRAAAEVAKVGIEKAAEAVGPSDDTPGKITAAEWAEIVEVMAKKAKEIMSA